MSSSEFSESDDSINLDRYDDEPKREDSIRMVSSDVGVIKHVYVDDRAYPFHLSSGLYKLQQQASFCDVTIIVGGQRFSAHKAVLSCACDYFQGMFSSGFQESTKNEITVAGVPESFAKLLEFAYTGHFTLSPTTVIDILKLASYMVFTQAMKACAKYLEIVMDNLSMDDCFKVWKWFKPKIYFRSSKYV